MSSVRSLDTLWSRVCVCAKVVVVGVGGGEGVTQGRSAEISRALWEDGGGIRAGRTSERAEEGDGWKESSPNKQKPNPKVNLAETRRRVVNIHALKIKLLPLEGSRHCTR